MAVDSPYPEQIANETNLRDVVPYVDTYEADHMNIVRAYIRDITATLGTNPHGSLATLKDRLAVRIADDGTFKEPGNLITVGPSLCMFSSITDALAAITDNAELNPYTILLYPGQYDESIALKNHVNIISLARGAALVNGNVSDDGVSITCKLAFNIKNSTGPGLSLSGSNSVIYVVGHVESSSHDAVLAGCQQLYYDGSAACSASGKAALAVSGGVAFFSGRILNSLGAASCIKTTGGALTVKGELQAGAAVPVVHSGGLLRLFNTTVKCAYNSPSGHALQLDSHGAVLANTALSCANTSAKSLYATSIKTISTFFTVANTDKATPVQLLYSAGFVVNQYVLF